MIHFKNMLKISTRMSPMKKLTKKLSGFPHTVKWRALDTDVSPEIESDNDFNCQAAVCVS